MKTATDGRKQRNGDSDGFKGLGRYALFPLALLAQKMSWEALRESLIKYSIMRFAKRTYQEMKEAEQRQGFVRNVGRPLNAPEGFDPSNKQHRAIGGALRYHNQDDGSIGSMKQLWACYRAGRHFLRDHGLLDDSTQDAPPFVPIDYDVLDPRSGMHSLTERDLRVLMAINAGCGKNRWRIINETTLGLWALGAKREDTAETLKVKPLTRWQVRGAVEKLQRQGWIRREGIGKWTFFAVGMQEEEFQDTIHKWINHRTAAGKARRRTVEEFMQGDTWTNEPKVPKKSKMPKSSENLDSFLNSLIDSPRQEMSMRGRVARPSDLEEPDAL